jgi:hypothetical protein
MRRRSLFAACALLLPLIAACGGGGGLTRDTTIIDNPVLPPEGPPVHFPPATAIRRTFGMMATGRYKHTATLIEDARVLIAGGTVGGTTITDRCEIYQSSSQIFLPLTATMRYPRSNHTATRLEDGRVLLAGGWVEVSTGVLQAQARAEVYDPSSGGFTEVGQMTHGRADHAAVRLGDGRVLITGGSDKVGESYVDFSDAEIFDPATGQFTAHPTGMAHVHTTHACLDLLDGRFLATPGFSIACEIFDEATEEFTLLAPTPGMGQLENACATTFESGGAVIAGGDALGSVFYLRPHASLLLNSGSPLSVPRDYATATPIAVDHVLVAGGIDITNNNLYLGSCDLIVEGGLGGVQTYPTAARFPFGMVAHTATALGGGRVLFCGGEVGDAGHTGRRDAFLFVP